jgi:hypothetical protein
VAELWLRLIERGYPESHADVAQLAGFLEIICRRSGNLEEATNAASTTNEEDPERQLQRRAKRTR